MSGFDDPGVYYSDSFGGGEGPGGDEGGQKRIQIKKRFREFLRQFRVGTDRTGFTYKYRDELKRHYTLGEYWLEVEMEDLASFDEDLSDCLYKLPTENLPLLEEAAKEVADEVTRPRPVGEEAVQDIQVTLKSDAHHASIRSLKSEQVSRLVKVHGIIISATAVKAKATKVCLQCRGCRAVIPNIPLPPGLQGYALPRKCNSESAGRVKCPVDPYFIIPDRCVCVDFQTLRLQESPDAVPHGEMPRHLQLYCDRYLCDRVVPGNRVTIMGIYSIKKMAAPKAKGKERGVGVGIRASYLRVVGIQVDTEGAGRGATGSVSPQEEEELRALAASPNVYNSLSQSIAPSIYGSDDVKKAITCLLFGGSRKRRGLSSQAGITTTLNSRCSVLAAANSVYGRWDDTKGEDNIDFMPTILSRFDMIFIIKDQHDQQRDMTLARHVMNVHLSAQTQTEGVEGEIPLTTFKKYIAYARTKCGPRLSAAAAEKLKNRYVVMRSGAREHERESDKRASIPITVRQLEAVVRIAESLAKMKLQAVAGEEEVDEALRLFQVSTLDAALSGSLSGAEGFTSQEDQEMISRIEKQLKRRFAIGSQVSEHSIIQDFTKQKYPEHAIYKVLHLMLRRGELQHRMQRKVLYRVK
ncbi:DNA replication licensing factor MCM5 [Pundamilia nyererei]|uniref:DNA replication licensing factor MCM5 n=1 Tax=Pundamilia nyererei TaxID=303518 RepID=A0A9Y3VPE8_9CICH|nr:PREDICTED: DNA replication licensing factor MCM5 [Pundamilia nyererei]